MGLDNIPYKYPCKTAGTAEVDAEDRIDCEATRLCGGCPWHDELGNEPGVVYGMMGAPCWYRGKHGNQLLDTLNIEQSDLITFFADTVTDDGVEVKSPMACHATATDIEQALGRATDDETRTEAQYAAKWLRWVADKCDGAVAWW